MFELHELLAALGRELGSEVFDDADSFRGALDDFAAEDDATSGDINLLVDAIKHGGYRRMLSALESGASPTAAVEAGGELLSRERGTTDVASSQWACAALGYAVGKVDVVEVRRHRTTVDSYTMRRDDRRRVGEPSVPPVGVSPAPTPTELPSQQAAPTPAAPAQQGPPPGWDPHRQPAYARPATRSKLPLIIAAEAAAVLVIVVVLALVLRGGGSSPEAATEDYVAAIIDRDCDALQAVLTADLQDQVGPCSESSFFYIPKDASFELGDITVMDETDDSATVEFTITVDGEESTGSLGMVKEDGDWKIDAFEF